MISRGTIFIRLAVGLIFLTQGILKYTDAHMGVDRFTRIGFSHPAFTAHFVGAVEMVSKTNCCDGEWLVFRRRLWTVVCL